MFHEFLVTWLGQLVDVHTTGIESPNKKIILNPIHGHNLNIPRIGSRQTRQYLQLCLIVILIDLYITLAKRNNKPPSLALPTDARDLRIHLQRVNKYSVLGIRNVEEPVDGGTVQNHVYFIEMEACDGVFVAVEGLLVLVVGVGATGHQLEDLDAAVR